MTRAASISFCSACLSPAASPEVSTFSSAGANRAIMRFSSAKSGIAAKTAIQKKKGASFRMPPIY